MLIVLLLLPCVWSQVWLRLNDGGDVLSPSPRAGGSAACQGSSLFIVGGRGPNGMLADVWEYTESQWSQLASPPLAFEARVRG